MEISKIQDLIHWQERLVGLEFENPIIDSQGQTVDFAAMQKVFQTFGENGWDIEKDYILGCVNKIEKNFGPDRVNLITDSGAGNLETAMPPQQNVQDAEKLYTRMRSDILKVLKKHNLTIAGFALQPGTIPDMKKYLRRNAMYLALDILDSSDLYANLTSTTISAHQAGVGVRFKEAIDYANEIIKIAGLIVALCANSPIHNFQILPWKEWRILIVGLLRFVGNTAGFNELCGFPQRPYRSITDYLKYYWQKPWMILPPLREGKWVLPNEKMNFLEYFSKSPVPAHDLEGNKVELVPNPDDLNWAMICNWPHAKPHIVLDPKKVTVPEFMENFRKDALEEYLEGKVINCYLECRAGAAAPVGEEMAIPALMLGLVNNIDGVKEITKLYSWQEWSNLVFQAAAKGMEVKIKGTNVIPLLQDLTSIAEEGLKRRNFGEEKYLEPVKERIKERRTPADHAMEYFQKGKKEFLQYISY